jgi:hypothetical protein
MTDASDVAVGAVLQQRVNNVWQPLGFFSKRLQPAETRYSTFGRELLAVYLSTRHFRHHLEARQFFVLTDHKPLTYALHNSINRHSPREIRHLDLIFQFTTDLRHVSGNANPVADALSRIATLTPSSTIDFDAMACAQHNDEELNKIRNDSSSSTMELRDQPVPTSKTILPAPFPPVNLDLLFPRPFAAPFWTPSTTFPTYQFNTTPDHRTICLAQHQPRCTIVDQIMSTMSHLSNFLPCSH